MGIVLGYWRMVGTSLRDKALYSRVLHSVWRCRNLIQYNERYPSAHKRNSSIWGERTHLVTEFFSLGSTSESQCDVLLKPAWSLFPLV